MSALLPSLYRLRYMFQGSNFMEIYLFESAPSMLYLCHIFFLHLVLHTLFHNLMLHPNITLKIRKLIYNNWKNRLCKGVFHVVFWLYLFPHFYAVSVYNRIWFWDIIGALLNPVLFLTVQRFAHLKNCDVHCMNHEVHVKNLI